MKEKEKTQSVRINQKKAKEIKVFVAQHGGTMKGVLEKGATYIMNAFKKAK